MRNKYTDSNEIVFFLKKIIRVDKLNSKNISIILFQGLLMYEQNTCKNTRKKEGKRKIFKSFAK